MDQKIRLWRKKSSEKTIIASDMTDVSLKGNEQEALSIEKETDLEKSVKDLNEKLASLLCDCKTKDELLEKHRKSEEEAIAGREKAEAEAVFLNQELDEASKQLLSVQNEENRIIEDYKKARKDLEEKLTETNRNLSNLAVENAHLNKALLLKEKLVEELSKSKYEVEAESNVLMARLDSIEKENTFLRYEFRMLERELAIRNEKREYELRSVDALQKQNSENLKIIRRLELECERLRHLGHTKLKTEVQRIGRKLNSTAENNSHEISSKRINFLIERLCKVEEENKVLKEELLSTRLICARKELKLAEAESQLEMFSKDKKCMELAKIEDTAIISVCTGIGDSNMSLMDDFLEMEKLAIVSADTSLENSYVASDDYQSVLTGKELIPVVESTEESTGKSCDWLQDVLKIIIEQHRVSGRSSGELLDDIRTVLGFVNHSTADEANKAEEIKKLKEDLKNMQSEKKDLEERLQSGSDKIEALMIQLQEMEAELDNLREMKGVNEDQMETQKLINEDLNTQLSVAKSKINEVLQKISSLEVELDDKYNCCEELEATCLELQLQLESVMKKELPKYEIVREEKPHQTGWEITAASVKLAECQETILNLGKQLKALAPPREIAIFDKIFSTTITNNKNPIRRLSLRDRMLVEDSVELKVINSPEERGMISKVGTSKTCSHFTTMAIVKRKKWGGVAFLGKLLLRRKGTRKKTSVLVAG